MAAFRRMDFELLVGHLDHLLALLLRFQASVSSSTG